MLGDEIHHATPGLARLVAHVGHHVLGLVGDRVLGLLLQMLRTEPLAQLVDVAAHALAGPLDLELDLLGTLLPRGRVAPGRVLPLFHAHGRCSFAHWMSSLMVSTVRRGVGSVRLRSLSPRCNITHPTMPRSAPTMSAASHGLTPMGSIRRRMIAAVTASPPTSATTPPAASETRSPVTLESLVCISVLASWASWRTRSPMSCDSSPNSSPIERSSAVRRLSSAITTSRRQHVLAVPAPARVDLEVGAAIAPRGRFAAAPWRALDEAGAQHPDGQCHSDGDGRLLAREPLEVLAYAGEVAVPEIGREPLHLIGERVGQIGCGGLIVRAKPVAGAADGAGDGIDAVGGPIAALVKARASAVAGLADGRPGFFHHFVFHVPDLGPGPSPDGLLILLSHRGTTSGGGRHIISRHGHQSFLSSRAAAQHAVNGPQDGPSG